MKIGLGGRGRQQVSRGEASLLTAIVVTGAPDYWTVEVGLGDLDSAFRSLALANEQRAWLVVNWSADPILMARGVI
jgi:hypothetical protein